MKKIERVKYLYDLLSKKKMGYDGILFYFEKKGVKLSLRQLQRDLNDLELTLREHESLVKKRNSKKGLELEIQKEQLRAPSIITSDFNTLLIKNSDEKISFFDEAIQGRYPVRIGGLKLDSTSFNADFKTKRITVFPIQLISHRSSLYLGCLMKKNNQYAIFNLNNISSYRRLSKPYKIHRDELIEGFNTYTKNIFGVTKNIDENTYTIKLEFSSVTGKFIQRYKWHHSQKFKQNGPNVIMTLKCGINRELVGWIFSWLYNVRILGPTKLQSYYNKTLNEILDINQKKTVYYKNIFVQNNNHN